MPQTSISTAVRRRHGPGGRRRIEPRRTRLRSGAAPGDGEPEAATALLRLLRPAPDRRVEQMSSTDLAYIGDAVYELLVRSKFVWPSKRTSDLQNRVVGLVRAEHQSRLLASLRDAGGGAGTDGFALTAAEQQVLARGRNAPSGGGRPRRDPAAYQDATALEALIGYTFLTDALRCRELLRWIQGHLEDA